MDAEIAVENGAIWMDEFLPGWEHKINLNQLKMQSGEHCILGQATKGISSYYDTVTKENPDNPHSWAVDHGFDASREGIPADEWWTADVTDLSELAYSKYRQLEVLWTEEVQRRVG